MNDSKAVSAWHGFSSRDSAIMFKLTYGISMGVLSNSDYPTWMWLVVLAVFALIPVYSHQE